MNAAGVSVLNTIFHKLKPTVSNRKKIMDMRKYVDKMVFCRPDEK